MTSSWPTAAIDRVGRLRVLAAANAGAMFVEETIDQPIDAVWPVAADLETALPQMIRTMRSFTIADRDRDPFSAVAVSVIGHHARFDVTLRYGWCLMQSRYVIGGMAAVPDGDRTRFAVLGGGRMLRIGMVNPAGSYLGHSMISRLRERLAA